MAQFRVNLGAGTPEEGCGPAGRGRTYPKDAGLRTQAFGAHLHYRVGTEGDAGLVLAHGGQPQGHIAFQLQRGHQNRPVSGVHTAGPRGFCSAAAPEGLRPGAPSALPRCPAACTQHAQGIASSLQGRREGQVSLISSETFSGKHTGAATGNTQGPCLPPALQKDPESRLGTGPLAGDSSVPLLKT